MSAAFSCSRSGSSIRLPLLPDDIDLRIVGDGFERDVRHALIDKTLADVAMRGLARRHGPGDFGFFQLAVAAVGQQVIGIPGTHDASTSQRERHARGVDGDPAAAPLLCDIGGGAGTAGGVEHEVAGIGGHQEAALDYIARFVQRKFSLFNQLRLRHSLSNNY